MEEPMAHVHRIMLEFEEKVNNSPEMNVKMKWWEPGPGHKNKNDPVYWVGVLLSAYKREVITKTEATDVLLALKAWGANGDYFNLTAAHILGR